MSLRTKTITIAMMSSAFVFVSAHHPAKAVVAVASHEDEKRQQTNWSRDEVKELVAKIAAADGRVPVSLALAVAETESSFRHRAVSSAGARGVMQIMPLTAERELGSDRELLFDPEINIRLGIEYLHRLYVFYGRRWEAALSHYNGGTLRGKNAHSAKPHSYTENYVSKVLHASVRFEKEYKLTDGTYSLVSASKNTVDGYHFLADPVLADVAETTFRSVRGAKMTSHYRSAELDGAIREARLAFRASLSQE